MELGLVFSLTCGMRVAARKPRHPSALGEEQAGAPKKYETVYRYCFQLAALFLRRHVRH
jgi:hypothetical protein